MQIQTIDIDRVFHALGDATRRQMLETLSEGPISVSRLAEPLDMSLPAVVQHLQILQDCGLVTTEKVGRVRTCRIDAKVLSLAEKWINERRSTWERRFDRLGDVLGEDNHDKPSR